MNGCYIFGGRGSKHTSDPAYMFSGVKTPTPASAPLPLFRGGENSVEKYSWILIGIGIISKIER